MEQEKIAREIRKKIIKMNFDSQTAHLGSALSAVEILVALYFKILSVDPKNPLAEGRDRFILSKGHAVSALYATLAQSGFFSEELLENYYKDGSNFPGHSTLGYGLGVEATSGSLGHGLSIGAGLAIAGKNSNPGYRVFVLMSDGECQEGQVWEAALLSAQHKLDNLVGIVDYNKLQGFGRVSDIMDLEPFREKWSSFGWGVKEVQGHNLAEIEKALSKIPFEKGKPSLLLAHTVKGKGVSFLENKMESHYLSLNKEQYEQVLKELS